MSGDSARRLLLALSTRAPRSGSALAAQTGVTRAAVWKQIEALRADGVAIEARAGQGYRLVDAVELLDADVIGNELPDALRARIGPIDVQWEIDSTNSALLRALAGDDGELAVCLAERQTRGRGRRGRAWHMPLAGGLALSLRRRFEGGMATLAGLSLVVGIAVARALERASVRGIGLKWPNDIVADGRKLGGILVELAGEAHGPCQAVIGVGVNLRLGAAGTTIDQPWTDLATLAGSAAIGRNRLAAQLMAELVTATDRFAARGFPAFADEWARRDVLRDRQVRILAGSHERHGVARGVDAQGRLRVHGDDGEFGVDSGEVSVRADDGARG